jgi:homoserine dehydrogenase
MKKDNLPFDVALKEAQKLGFAEADPTLDVNGGDSAHKAIVLAQTVFGIYPSQDDILVEGIEDVSAFDMQMADELGYEIKLLAILKKDDEDNCNVEIRVHPAMVKKDHLLSKVENELNALFVEGDFVGPTLFYGRGAGQDATASAVVSDIIKTSSNKGYSRTFELECGMKDIDDIKTRYYIKMLLKDEPGVLAKVAKVLGDNNISLSAVLQKEKEKEFVPVLFISHDSKERDVQNALDKLSSEDYVKGRPKIIRIID